MDSGSIDMRTGERPRRRRRRAGLFACLLAACFGVAAQPIPQAIVQARELGGRDPAAAHGELARLRAAAVSAHDVALRLYADEADCRLLSDSDAPEAARIAQAGIAAAPASGADGSLRDALVRLRACAGGVLLDIGQTDAGNALLERALAESARDDAMAGPHALALLERGLHRSRRGDMLEGQEDLLAACSALEALPLPQDLELCRSHLANHYKRMGDTDEALRLLEDLLEAARRRGATADVAVYVYGLAQVRYERREWQGAAEAFEESIRLSKVLDDPLGVAYAEHGLGHTLLRLNRPQQALEHAQHALRLLGEDRDPVQQLRTTILQANALSDLERFTQADTRLRGIENRVRDSKDATLLADWLLMHSEIQARLGQWKDAYESLAEWRPLNAQTQDQRLSQQTARLRLQFHRERDAAELAHLRRLNAKGDEALQAQRLALVLFLVLLAAAIAYGARKLRHMRKLQRLATVDELSGLPNRRASMAYLEDCLRRAHTLDQPLSVLMVDIDHFKSINDRHGHAKGDEVIREVARTLGGAVRLQDRAGRIGGEEFLVVLPGATTSHAQAIAERMRAGVQQLGWSDAGESDPVTVSIGVASRVDRDSAASLVTRADQALYAAKNQGRNRVVSMPPAP